MTLKRRWFGSVSALVITIAAGMGTAHLAKAQETVPEGTEPGAEPDEVTVPDVAAMSPISIYATRSPIPAFDYPGQATVIERDRILSLQPSSVFDVLEGVPGVQIPGGPRRSGQTISLRGLEGEGVLILFDGARQSFVSGHDGRAFIDPSLLQAVEVIRGPGSALYGSGALGGVVAFRTIDAADFLEPGETMGAQVGIGYQDVNEEFSSTGTVFGRTQDGIFDGVASITYRGAGDIELGSGFTLPSDDDILSGLVKGTATLTDGLAVSASYLGYYLDASDPNNPQGDNVVGPTNALVDREARNDTVQARIEYSPAGNDWIDLSIVPYYTRSAVEEPEANSDRFLLREVETTGIAIDNRTRFNLSDTVDMTLTYGAEYYRDEQQGEDSRTATGERGGVPDAQTDVGALFVQGEIRLADLGAVPGELSVIPALRYDHYSSEADDQRDIDEDAFSPRIAVSYEPTPWLNLFASYAEGFRAPSFDELYGSGTHFPIVIPGGVGPPTIFNNVFVPNPDLEPERSETVEIGLGVEFDDVIQSRDALTAKGSYYWSDVDNLIDLDVDVPAGCFGAPFPPCGSGAAFGNTSTYLNVANAEIQGFEFELQYDSPRTYATASFATIDGENRDNGEPVGVLFPNRFYADVGVDVFEVDLRLGSRLTLAGDFTNVTRPQDERDGYATVDLYATWAPLDGPLSGLRVDVGVDNVGDTDYEVVSAGVSEPGRNFRAAVSYSFAF